MRANIDRLYDLASQLGAMLHIIGGEGLERFNNCTDKAQMDYLFACSSLADEIETIAGKLADVGSTEEGGQP